MNEQELDTAHPGNAVPQPGMRDADACEKLLSKDVDSSNSQKALPLAWRDRGYMPHFDGKHIQQSLTFRLVDSLPHSKLLELEKELEMLPEERRTLERRRSIERWLDAGMGCCALGHASLAQIMQDTLLKWDGDRYQLLAWCIMPNHVHVLIQPNVSLGIIMRSWKSFTGRWARAHAQELAIPIPEKGFWMREYWDRYIRNEAHYTSAYRYIENNPVQARLCTTKEAWRWSSARAGSAVPQPGMRDEGEEKKPVR